MQHLKTFESVNYGNLHFDIPIFEYFPWYKYPASLNRKPEIDLVMWRFFLDIVPNKFDKMVNVWWFAGDGDPHDTLTGGPWTTNLTNGTILVDPQEEFVSVNGQHFSADDWGDVEKIRLMHNLGTKSQSSEYIDFIRDSDDLLDAYLYMMEENPRQKFKLGTIGDFWEDISDPTQTTDEDVMEFVRNYTGDERFFNSLKNYLLNYGKLTQRQIDAARKEASKSPIQKIKDRPCMLIVGCDSSRPTPKRLKSRGFQIKDTDLGVLIYRL